MTQATRVLIADDNVRTRDGLRALLSTWGDIEVVGEATDGEEAVRLVAEYQPDAVLMDLQMPVLDGLEATRRIKERWPQINVIVLTLHIAKRPAALAAGADTFLLKGELWETLRVALRVKGLTPSGLR